LPLPKFNFSFIKMPPFLKSTLSEPDGSGSAVRVWISAIVGFVVGTGVALVSHIHGPVTVADFDSFLGAAGLFIATVAGPLYLINKGANVLNKNPTDPSNNSKDQNQG